MRSMSSMRDDPSRQGSRVMMLLVFSCSLLCAICGFVTAGALGYAPF